MLHFVSTRGGISDPRRREGNALSTTGAATVQRAPESAPGTGASSRSIAAAAAPLLRVQDIAIRFGGIVALDKVSFDIAPGQILGLIGQNGAGKTTLFNCVSRLYDPDTGDILFRGASILREPAHRIARLGITRTFQNLALFHTMSVVDNIRVGAHSASRGDFASDARHLRWVRRKEEAIDALVADLLAELGLGDVAARRVADLPTGT